MRYITALPVYNEAAYISAVLDGATVYSDDVLVVDDGSDDGSAELLSARDDIHLVQHPQNLGYGAAVRNAFRFAAERGYDVLVTIDCDGQHQPQLIPRFVEAIGRADVVSGSRYLRDFPGDSEPPPQRKRINQLITEELNTRLGLQLTDAFCGFKAYRVAAIHDLPLRETGYAMPLEFWVRAAERKLRIVEMPVPLVYLDEDRSFGGSLDRGSERLRVYREVLARAMADTSGNGNADMDRGDARSAPTVPFSKPETGSSPSPSCPCSFRHCP